MELYNILRSLTVDELKTVKKISTELIKEKQPKKVVKTRDSKIQDVKDKLDMGTYSLNYHELMYAFEIISRRHGYPVTINVRDEVAFIKRAFGDKPKDGFGKFEVKQREEREGVNPKTKERITIAASKSPVFKPSKLLKEAVK